MAAQPAARTDAGRTAGDTARLISALSTLSVPMTDGEPTQRICHDLIRLLAADDVRFLPTCPSGRLLDPADPDPDVDAAPLDTAAVDALDSAWTEQRDGGPVLARLGMATGMWVPVVGDDAVLGVLRITWAATYPVNEVDHRIAGAAAFRLGRELDRSRLREDAARYRQQRSTTLWVATELAGDLDIASLGRRIVQGVTEVTDFTVASLTVREGDTCRRVAAAGIDDARLGLLTEYPKWARLLREEYRRRSICFLIPPQGSETTWVQTVDVARPTDVDPVRGRWTAEHGLVVELLDIAGRRLGFLSVDAPASGLLPDDDEMEQLEVFARQAQAGLQGAQLHEQVRRQRDAAEALGAVGKVVSGSLDLGEVLKRCCDAVVEHSVGDRVSVYLYDDITGGFRPVMSRGIQDPELWRTFAELPPATIETVPAYGEAMRTGEPICTEHVTAPEHVRREEVELFGIKSAAVYPLRSGERFVGVLVVDTFLEHVTFPTHERDLVSRIALQAAVAIHQAQLHEESQAHAARARELYELTKEMTRTFDFDAVFDRIVQAVTTRTDAYSVGVMEVRGDELHLLRSNLSVDDRALLPYAQLPVAEVPRQLWDELAAGRSARIDDVRALPELKDRVRRQARSLLVGGHVEDGELSLVLHLTSDRTAAFTPDDAAFVQGLVEVAALALRNARLYDAARRNAERDSLTGLKNRRTYSVEVPVILAAADVDRPVSLAILDLDDFKAVNDEHGHDAGDEALIHVADRIRRSVRETDHVYRLGGEEFTVVMPGTTTAEAWDVVDRIRRSIAVSRDELPRLTVSAGVAAAPVHGTHLDELFRVADRALYAAKAAGKDRVHAAAS
jgi:diguanylate cyclase (GGDEF)-like protein